MAVPYSAPTGPTDGRQTMTRLDRSRLKDLEDTGLDNGLLVTFGNGRIEKSSLEPIGRGI